MDLVGLLWCDPRLVKDHINPVVQSLENISNYSEYIALKEQMLGWRTVRFSRRWIASLYSTSS